MPKFKMGDWIRIRPESKWPYPKFGFIVGWGRRNNEVWYVRVEFVDGLRLKYSDFDLIPLSEEEHAIDTLGQDYFA